MIVSLLMVLGKMVIHMEKSRLGSLLPIINKIELKMHHKPTRKSENYKILEDNIKVISVILDQCNGLRYDNKKHKSPPLSEKS